MPPLSVVLIVKNEAANIRRCLEAVAWADEITVLDTGSTDATVEICRAMGCQTHVLERWEGFGPAKQRAVDLATHDWILSLDADEILSPELESEIQDLQRQDFHGCAWRLKRRSYYLGCPIRHCGWQNDAPLRLFDRRQGGFEPKLVHEGVRSSQEIRTCKGWLHHFTYPTREVHFSRMRFYAELAARQKKEQGRRSHPLEAVLRAAGKFLRMYVAQQGFLDGRAGWQLCRDSAWGVWYRYHLLWKLSR